MSTNVTAMHETFLRKPRQDDGELVPELRLVPFSEQPEKQRAYTALLAAGWRFHHRTGEWFDLRDPDNIRGGRLCWWPDYSAFWIQPPGRGDTLPETISLLDIVKEG